MSDDTTVTDSYTVFDPIEQLALRLLDKKIELANGCGSPNAINLVDASKEATQAAINFYADLKLNNG